MATKSPRPARRFLLLLPVLLFIAPASEALKIAVLLPRARHNVTRMSLEQVLPVVDIAIAKARTQGWLADFNVTIVANDSMCDYTIAPVVAILLMKEVDLMLGPYCPFCLAAVARYNRFHLYRKPIVTTGGIASALSDKKEYFNLIRGGPAGFEGVERMLLQIFKSNNWLPRSVQTALFIERPDEEAQKSQTRGEIDVSQSRILCQGISRLFAQQKYIVRRLQYEPGNDQFNKEIFRVMREEVRRKMMEAESFLLF